MCRLLPYSEQRQWALCESDSWRLTETAVVGDGGRGRGSVFVKFLKSNSRVVCSGDRRGEKFEKKCVYHFLSGNRSPKEGLSRKESIRL